MDELIDKFGHHEWEISISSIEEEYTVEERIDVETLAYYHKM